MQSCADGRAEQQKQLRLAILIATIKRIMVGVVQRVRIMVSLHTGLNAWLVVVAMSAVGLDLKVKPPEQRKAEQGIWILHSPDLLECQVTISAYLFLGHAYLIFHRIRGELYAITPYAG